MTIANPSGEKLDYTLHPGSAKTIAIIGHGVTGNKDRPFIVALAEALSAEGIPALRFSFAGNGDSGGKFEESCISKEVGDLGAVFDAVAGDFDSICYIGHSMGGAVGVMRAAEDKRIRLLISLAGMVETAQFHETEFGQETPDKGCMWDDPDCPLSSLFANDMKTIGSVVGLAPKIQVPWLLAHGTVDDVVPIQDSLDIFAKANEPKTLETIDGAGHVFADDATPKMISIVLGWLKPQMQS